MNLSNDWGWWGWLFVIVALLLAMGSMPGCSLIPKLEEYGDKAAEKLASAAKQYCEKVPKEQRLALREKINAALTPHSAQVNCFGD